MTKGTEVEVLLDAINDVQETIRAFDLKAEILTGIMTLLVGMVAFAWHDQDSAALKTLDIVVIVTAFGAMGCLMAVLFPMNGPVEKVKLGGYKPAGTYYLDHKKLAAESVTDFAKKLTGVNWLEELSFELMKVSAIRQRKHDWFSRATAASTLSFIALLLLCLGRYIPLVATCKS